MIDEEIKKVKSRSHHKGFTYSHPSFGRIRVSHMQGDAHIFGSEVQTSRPVSITISECEVTQDLGTNWYHAHNQIVEAWMTPVQYAEMIASPNTEGVPCTIKTRADIGKIKSKTISTMTEFARSEVQNKADDLYKRVSVLSNKITECLQGPVKKADKDMVIGLVRKLVQDIGPNFKFQEKCVHENIERSVMEAKAEVDHHITQAISRLGVKALENPEAIKLLLGSNTVDNKLIEQE